MYHTFCTFFTVTARFSDVKLPNFPFNDNANIQRPGERLLTTTNLSFSFLNWKREFAFIHGVSESFLKWCFRHRWNRCELPNSWYQQKSSTLITKNTEQTIKNWFYEWIFFLFFFHVYFLGHIPWQTSRKKDFVTCHQVSQWVLWMDWWAEGERGRDHCSPCNSSLLPRARSRALNSFPLPFLTLSTQANPRVTTD